jgi:hypothetical protein
LLKPESSLFSVKFMGLRHGGNTEGGQCFYDLIVDLQRLNASTDARSSEPSIQPAADRGLKSSFVRCCPIADNREYGLIVRFVPIADISKMKEAA